MGRLLGFLGGNAILALFLGVFLGLLLPDLADLARPLLAPCVVALLIATLLRVEWDGLARHARRPGVILTVTLWLLVDKAVIEADEHLNREEFEAGLREALAEEREALRAELKAGYIDGVGAVLARIRSDLEEALEPRPIAPRRDFVPARAVARGEP